MGRLKDVEGPIHRSVLAYLRMCFPGALIHHSPGESHIRGKTAMLATVKKKRDGMVTGFPDLVVFPAGVLPMFFEVKAPKGVLSDSQKDVHKQIEALGYNVAVVRSVEEVRKCLLSWGVPFTEKIELRGAID